MAYKSNTALRVAELDFFGIRDNLKNYLRSQPTFTDYDFDGAGLSVLVDLLAYNTYYNSFYLNMVANESFLDTAQIRGNILSHAKNINYIPHSARGASTKINIVVTPSTAENQTLSSLTLDRFTRLIGQDVDGTNYTFVTVNANTVSKSAGSFTYSNVVIKQGEVLTQQYLVNANNTYRRFEIPSANVDTSSLMVTVQTSSSNTVTEEYFAIGDITEVDGNSAVYFLEENENLNYTIGFGDGILGKRPDDGNIVIVTYLDTVGAISNGVSKFIFIEPIGGKYRDNVITTSVQSTYGGVDKEDIDAIRLRAPYAYTAQNRCVTTTDYESLMVRDFENIDAISVWGGEDNDPPVYGKVYMSLKTKGFYILTELEKENIKKSLIENRNVLTVTPEIVDPDFNFILVRGKVYYNPAKTTKTQDEILTVVKNAIQQYNDIELNTFKSTFRRALLQRYIEDSDVSITGSDIYVYLQKRLPVTVGEKKTYNIYFNAALGKGNFERRLYTYPSSVVQDTAGTLRLVYFEEVPNSFTGVDSISVINSGINYNAPTVTISGDGTGATAKANIVNGKIRSIEVTNKGINYTRATVSITDTDGTEATAVAVLQAKVGDLRTYYYKDNGEKVYVDEAAGTINYETGKITLDSFNPLNTTLNEFYDDDILTVNVVPEDQVISPLRNRIFGIDTSNPQTIQVELVTVS